MILVLTYFYLAILLVGLAGGWVLRRGLRVRAQSVRVVQWVVVLYPMGLAAVFLLKPGGPHAWTAWVPCWGPWDRTLLLAVLATVTLHGIWETILVSVGWARLRHGSLSGRNLAAAPWLAYQAMGRRLGLIVLPDLRIHRDLHSPLVVGWRHPDILVPARLVPTYLRTRDPFWDGVAVTPASRNGLRAMIAHELGHVRLHHNLSLWLVALNGCLVPWEWIVGRTVLERGTLSRSWPIQMGSSIARILGWPYRWGINAVRQSQELEADQAVTRVIVDGGTILAKIRMAPRPSVPARVSRLWEDWREVLFAMLLAGTMVAAPGWSTIRFTLEGKMTPLLELPATWALAIDPGFGKASAGRIPGQDGSPGLIVVELNDGVPGHWPMLRGTGRFEPQTLAARGELEVIWDIHSPVQPPDRQAVMVQCAAIPIVEDVRQDAVTVMADPFAPVECLGGDLFRYQRRLDLTALPPRPFFLYLKCHLRGSGRWQFHPPTIRILGQDGQHYPFPST